MSIPVIPERGAPRKERMVPIAEASGRLGPSVWTLKRMFKRGLLPVVTIDGRWMVHESFIDQVLASPRPAQAGVIEEVARDWWGARNSEAVA